MAEIVINPKSLFPIEIGNYIINMGGLELITARLITKIGKDPKKMTLGKKVECLEANFPNGDLERYNWSRSVFEKANDLVKFRNRIAHSPLCIKEFNGIDTLAIVDMKGTLEEVEEAVISINKLQSKINLCVEIVKCFYEMEKDF